MIRIISPCIMDHISMCYGACLNNLINSFVRWKTLQYACLYPSLSLFERTFFILNEEKGKKVAEKFGGFRKSAYLCTRLEKQGRLAQLV